MRRPFMRPSFFAALFALVLVSGCATKGYNKGQFNLMSVEDEAKWGAKLKADVDKELKAQGKDYHDPEVVGYIDRLGRKLLQEAPEVDFDYTFDVVKTDVVNAFAVPGGHVYVNTALIAEADNEAELAGVMAHEIGHVVARHGSERLSALMAASMVGSVLVSSQADVMDRMLTDLAVQLATTGGALAYSRANEEEADMIGVKIMYDAGYDPRGMARFFKKLNEQEGDMTRFEVFMSTHPDPGDRRKQVKDYIKTLPERDDLIWDSPEFDKVHAVCGALDYGKEKREDE